MNFLYTFNKQIVIKLSVVLIIALIFFLFPNIRQSINHETENFYYKILPEALPDTNIVIIHFDENDIDALGPWPVKRSIYALIIKELTDLNVKKIGLEVFLSSKFATQSIYDNVLTKQILKSKRVVLSSLTGNIYFKDGVFTTDSLSYPTPKLLNDNIVTGHINVLTDHDIIIPLSISKNDEVEESFSSKIAGIKIKLPNNYEKVNFVSNWKNFDNYTVLNFFKLLRNKPLAKYKFKDKMVLIGISAKQFAKIFSSAYNNQLPGVAVHAFAVENLMNKRYLKSDFLSFSKYLALFFILLILYRQKNFPFKSKIASNTTVLFFVVVSGLVIFKIFHYQLSYSDYVIPLLSFLIIDSVFYFYMQKDKMQSVYSEAEALKSLLKNKEMEYEKLQRELDILPESDSSDVLSKIQKLKSEIEKIKENEFDSQAEEKLNITEENNFHGIIYKSKVMNDVVQLIKTAAPEDASILILGESGTGKELIAKAIHSLSKRSNKNFVAVNCGALSSGLLESELFGHVKGAFTGAVADKMGRFEAADNGTIFLDEIAETDENFQVKLLRVLQSGEFEKVGSSKTQKVNVRVIAATNKDIDKLMETKKFREDLYYRLNVIRINVPPLRNRIEDIKLIAQYFLDREDNNFRISFAVLNAFESYDWKGNVRELESVIKRAIIFAKADNRKLIQLNDLPAEIAKKQKLNFEDLVLESLRNKKFSHSAISETAKELGDVGRTVISENLRGILFKNFIENDFDVDITAKITASTDDRQVIDKVKEKLIRFLSNIENDCKPYRGKDFEFVKDKFKSKYKNLPQKFHIYLDEIIKRYIN